MGGAKLALHVHGMGNATLQAAAAPLTSDYRVLALYCHRYGSQNHMVQVYFTQEQLIGWEHNSYSSDLLWLCKQTLMKGLQPRTRLVYCYKSPALCYN